ncbi:MAG: CAP domain-containing protein [Microthrixaceae bacterium]
MVGRRSRSRTRGLPALVAALVVTGGVLAPTSLAQRSMPVAGAAPTSAASPSPEFESQFVGRINSLRASKGLSQLQVSGELVGVARNWTEQMVSNGDISHNPNLGSQVKGNWTKLGENVGVGYDVDGLMQAFINSSAHYKNLVDPEWNYVGVGVVMTPDGRMWTTHNFMAKPSGAAPAPAPAPKPQPAPAAPKPKPAGPSPTTTAPPPPPPPEPHPNEARVTAVLDPLRALERG